MELAGLASRSGPNAAGYAAGIGPLLWSLSVAAAAISLARHLNRAEHGRQATGAYANRARRTKG